MKVKIESEVVQSYPALSDPMDCSLPGSSVRGIFWARVLEWGAIAFSDNIINVCIYSYQNSGRNFCILVCEKCCLLVLFFMMPVIKYHSKTGFIE